jgi:hypothetical protein
MAKKKPAYGEKLDAVKIAFRNAGSAANAVAVHSRCFKLGFYGNLIKLKELAGWHQLLFRR